MSFITDAFAQTATTTAATEPNALFNLLPLALIFVVFYVFLIRPQQQKMKEQIKLINSIKRGDEVVTSGGIIGKVTKAEENEKIAHIEIASGVVVRVSKATIVEVVKE